MTALRTFPATRPLLVLAVVSLALVATAASRPLAGASPVAAAAFEGEGECRVAAVPGSGRPVRVVLPAMTADLAPASRPVCGPSAEMPPGAAEPLAKADRPDA